jgi:hypothetical protein
MISFELCLEKQSAGGFSSLPSANAASCGHGGSWRGGGNSRGCGRSCGNGRGAPINGSHGGYNNYYNNTHRSPDQASGRTGGRERPQCQVCGKVGHTAVVYWYRYDEDYALGGHMAATTSSSGTDPNWYLNSGAIDHITSELEKMTLHDRLQRQ